MKYPFEFCDESNLLNFNDWKTRYRYFYRINGVPSSDKLPEIEGYSNDWRD